jgi:O-antigen/teichoic acid export membrane protein
MQPPRPYGSAMFYSLRRLAGQAAIYGLGRLVSPILALALLPLYTSYLGPARMGAWRPSSPRVRC